MSDLRRLAEEIAELHVERWANEPPPTSPEAEEAGFEDFVTEVESRFRSALPEPGQASSKALAYRCQGCGIVLDTEEHDGSASHARQTGSLTYEQCGPVNALCDASALPSLSQVLGELAVKDRALNEIRKAHDEAHTMIFGGCAICGALASALSSNSGRLAGEFLKAAIRLKIRSQEHRQVTRLLDEGNVALRDELAAWEAKRAAQATFRDLCDALLSACPAIRAEVERG